MAEDPSVGQFVIYGAGGHAKVALAALNAAGMDVAAIVAREDGAGGDHLLGHKVIVSADDAIPQELEAFPRFAAIGDNVARRDLVTRVGPALWAPIVHPQAVVHESVEIGPGALVCAGAVIQPMAKIGAHTIVNTGAQVDHDCEVGAFCHLGPGAVLCGSVKVGSGTFIAASATVIEEMEIGSQVLVGAGATVVRNVPDKARVGGTPAQPF